MAVGLREECGESSGCSYFSAYHDILGKPTKKQAGVWQAEKGGHFFSQAHDNILCLCAGVQGSVFIVLEYKIATCTPTLLHNWV